MQKPWVRVSYQNTEQLSQGEEITGMYQKTVILVYLRPAKWFWSPEMQSPISFLQRWADLQCLSHSETEVDVSSQTKQRINMAIQKWRAKRGKRSIFIYISFTVTLPPRSLCANWEHDCNIDYTQGNDSANRALVSIVFRFSVLNHKGLVCKHGEESSKGILTNLMINPS